MAVPATAVVVVIAGGLAWQAGAITSSGHSANSSRSVSVAAQLRPTVSPRTASHAPAPSPSAIASSSTVVATSATSLPAASSPAPATAVVAPAKPAKTAKSNAPATAKTPALVPSPTTSAVPTYPVATIPEGPATDASAFLAYLNRVRSGIKEPQFARNSCLDAQAAALTRLIAATPGGISIATYQPRALCGMAMVFTGGDTSVDPTGEGQAAAALTRGPAGQTTPVANASLTQIGFSMVQLRVGSSLTGYLVIWLLGG
jgi:hypothetical protein